VVQNLNPTPGSYVTIDRTWANGDVVDITMPMAISFEPTPDNANVKAVTFGGVVLCSAWTTTTMPTLNQSSVTATTTPLQFNATVDGSTAVTLIPFYKKVSGAYTVYFATNGSPPGPTPTPGVGPLHRYQFEGNANDSGSVIANGTLVNGPTFVAGRVGQAVNLDGSNDHVSLPAGILNGLTNFTIATWVKLDTTGAWRRIFDFGTGTNVYMFLTAQSGSNALRFAISTGGAGAEQRINGTSALPTGVWTHVAVTKSGNTGTLYVNGAQVGQNTAMTLNPSSLGNTTNNWLGRSQYADPFLDGQLDEFRIYNRALSASEILALFQNP
jgi:hypothetical protein